MPMYNLIEYSDNFAKTTGSLCQYCKDIPAQNNNNEITEFTLVNTTDSFKFKAKSQVKLKMMEQKMLK